MKALVKYVEQGGTLETHGDVPNTIRDQLYAEERQQIEKRQSPQPSNWIDAAPNQCQCRANPIVSAVR